MLLRTFRGVLITWEDHHLSLFAVGDADTPRALVVLYQNQAVAVFRPHVEGGFDCIRAEQNLLTGLGASVAGLEVHPTVRTLVFQDTEVPFPHLGVWIPTGSMALQVWNNNQLRFTVK